MILFVCLWASSGCRRNEADGDGRQPGILLLAGLGERDTVYLDGEEVPAAGLARSRNQLLLAPGSYSLKIITAEGATCESRLVVQAGKVSKPGVCHPGAKN